MVLRCIRSRSLHYAGAAVACLALAACGRIGFEASSDFVTTWDFATPAEYNYDRSFIEIRDGVARLTGASQSDGDNSVAGFGGGQLTSMNWNATIPALQLTLPATTGSFVSRGFTSNTTAPWTTLQWVPLAPYEKPLPDLASTAEPSRYRSGGVNMQGNRLLYHFDAAALTHNASIADNSGGTASAQLTAIDGNNKTIPGIVNNAIHFDGVDDELRVPPGTSVDDIMVTATDTATWSMWVRRQDTKAGTLLYKSDVNGNRGWWIDIREPNQEIGIAYICGSGNTRKYTQALPPPGEWFHLAITFSGGALGPPAAYHFFINGVEITAFSQADGCNSDHLSDATLPLIVGHGATGAASYFAGDLDELAIWARQLSANEVRALYTRGAQRLHLQVRACADVGCSDAQAFIGADGTAQSAFTDTMTSGQTVVAAIKPPIVARYLQYRIETSNRLGLDAPGVSSVTLASAGDQHVSNRQASDYRTLTAFAVDAGATPSDALRFALSPDQTTWYMWKAGSWQPALDGEGSSVTDVSANIAAFADMIGPGDFYFRVALAQIGMGPIELSSITIAGSR
jgi:hypothetical protein